MTFRQILRVLWKGAWLIVTLVVLAVVVAAVFLQREEPTYTATSTIRTNTFIAETAGSGSLAGVPVTLGTDVILTPAVLELAATAVGGGVTAEDLESAVTFEVEDADPTPYISISATTGSSSTAQSWANAVGDAYSQYLTAQTDEALATVREKQTAAIQQAGALQAQLSALEQQEIPQTDPVAQSNLDRALAYIDESSQAIDAVAAAGPPVTVVAAAGPGERQGTDPVMVFGIAISAALIAAIGILLIRDQFDDRLRGEREVERLTGVTSLGTLPYDRQAARGKQKLPLATRVPTAIGESLRALRAGLQVLITTGAPAAIVVTSVEPGDGKSFVSANLALAWARAGKRVILVGGDMRRPQLGTYFGEAGEGPGLADLLRSSFDAGAAPSTADVEALLNETTFRGLRVLPAGSEPDDPADLLASDLAGGIFDDLRSLADVVIIDSPPAMALADAGLIESHADGVVVLASEGRTLRSHLVATVGALETGSANIFGIVVNRSRSKAPRSYTAYYTKPSQSDDDTDDTTAEPIRRSRRAAADDQSGQPDFDQLIDTAVGGRRTDAGGEVAARSRAGRDPARDTPLTDA